MKNGVFYSGLAFNKAIKFRTIKFNITCRYFISFACSAAFLFSIQKKKNVIVRDF